MPYDLDGAWEAQLVSASPVARELRAMNDALEHAELSVAQCAWYAAYLAAAHSRTWMSMVAVGDAAARLARQSVGQATYEARAREAYLMALVRARASASHEGMLRVGRAFEALGDAALSVHCSRLARSVTGT